MKQNRTCVGLDVHARSVWACTVDDESGEMRTPRISPKTAEIVKWAKALPGEVEVAYEAGPTGFGLARELIAAGMQCHVLAPSKMQRPSGRSGEDRPVNRTTGPDSPGFPVVAGGGG